MDNAEKVTPVAGQYTSPPDSSTFDYDQGQNHNQPRSWSTRFIDSFKRDPNAHATPSSSLGADGKSYDIESAANSTVEAPLARHLKGRHLQMIAIGGSIGWLEAPSGLHASFC
jgi:amino acid transporter